MARYTVQTPDGPRRKTIYGRRYKDVEKKLAKARGDAAKGIIFDAGNLTVAEWVDRWLLDAVADTLRPVTYAKYEQIVRNHINYCSRYSLSFCPEFGNFAAPAAMSARTPRVPAPAPSC